MIKENKSNLPLEELILGYFEGNLSNEKASQIEDLVNSDDNTFKLFCSLYCSYCEMNETELEITPDILINKVNEKFNLDKSDRKILNQLGRIIDSIRSIIHNVKLIFKPRVVVFAMLSTCLIAFMIFSIVKNPRIKKEAILNKDMLSKLVDRSIVPTAGTLIEGITVQVFSDSIRIIQPIRIKRELIVESLDGRELLKKTFYSLESDISLHQDIKQDTIKVRILTLDSTVYEAVYPL